MGRLWASALTFLPQKWITVQAGRWAASSLSQSAIPWFIRTYDIDVAQAEKPWQEYKTLGEFFARRLRPGMRPVAQEASAIVSPVDGLISQMGTIEQGRMIQAKGMDYTAADLLADTEQAVRYHQGQFMTIYLSPRDYHRIHTPVTGAVTGTTFCPGRLYPVNDRGVTSVPGLLARNERVITYLDSPFGQVAVVKVGAMIVGSVQLAYEPGEAPGTRLEKGDELGHFQFGSTVILLFEPGRITWRPGIACGQRVITGQAIADGRT
ncbi:archaetidylserine decarboxylase [Heliophilum fasciatum]|uniref:Phosphatidylserine decarboxylase proenzyme n=1 Tax=Heliophilum fasciatum TaxID=35700 RepID=A0A4R2S729_9FIRM|nr:archaetidylserine decarboxylase [Heliophilum fasciatum]MCW2277174.1 phosphatidylserine decarboxylase [Heliophilum fasciatum]TCP68191.1 phosphatidylserine decarboxylase [Heliophilum fasciatum]